MIEFVVFSDENEYFIIDSKLGLVDGDINKLIG